MMKCQADSMTGDLLPNLDAFQRIKMITYFKTLTMNGIAHAQMVFCGIVIVIVEPIQSVVQSIDNIFDVMFERPPTVLWMS